VSVIDVEDGKDPCKLMGYRKTAGSFFVRSNSLDISTQLMKSRGQEGGLAPALSSLAWAGGRRAPFLPLRCLKKII